MRPRTTFLSALVVWLWSATLFAATAVNPTTTLTAETANNTSTAGSFLAQTNGNLGPGNVSKLPIRSLLYSGTSTKVYAHFMPWFGGANHMNVGYSSTDAAQVHRQVQDMVSRGIDGVIIDWYGYGNTSVEQATQLIKREAEATPGFTFAIMVDQGALRYCTTGCDPTVELVKQITYVANNYFTSPAYMRIGGRPVITNFDLDLHYSIAWSTVVAGVPGTPLFLFQHSGGFTHASSGGSYSWIILGSTPSDWSQAYLSNFYNVGKQYSGEHTVGAVYKGFNDSLAAWGAGRLMNQNCGQTWLNTFTQINSQYSAAAPLESLQIVTWNDYEEGTPIEMGIDNCVAISAGVTGNALSWTVSGNQSAVDHYTIFISTDGQNLMPLADVAPGSGSFNLATYGFAPATYKLFIKAVGKASFRNRMSSAITYTVLQASNQPPQARISVSPASGTAPVTITASTSGSSDADGTIVSSKIQFGNGSVANATTASHSYSTAGTYTVTGTVTDNSGAAATSSATVTVSNATPAITPGVTVTAPTNNAVVNSPVTVKAKAVSTLPITAMRIYMDNISVYTINAAVVNTSVSLAPGSHYVVVQAWDSSGAVYKSALNIKVNTPPVVAMSVSLTSGVAPVAVTATMTSSSDPDGTIVSRSINFGDGTTVTGATASHTYSWSGTYTITATVTDNNGAKSKAMKRVTISGASSSRTAEVNMTNTPSALSLRVGESGTATISITRQSGDAGEMTLACEGLPVYATCTFEPESVITATGATVSTTVNISTAAPEVAMRGTAAETWLAFCGLPGALVVMVCRLRGRRALVLIAFAMLLMVTVGCGGGGGTASTQSAAPQSASPPIPTPSSTTPIGTPTGAYEVTVVGETATGEYTAMLTLTVN